MKHHIQAALFSALGPGLGQFSNQRYFKGGVHMAVFNLIIALMAVLLVADCLPLWQDILWHGFGSWSDIRDYFRSLRPMPYALLSLAAAVMWIYSIIDAYQDGKRFPPDAPNGG